MDTIRALVQPTVVAELDVHDGFAFCRTQACDTAYYRAGVRVRRDEIRVAIFQKEPVATTPVCYCFGHTLGEIQDEVRRIGSSEVPERIKDACRQGLDRCETENPQGTCCLGNVRAVVRDTQAEMGTSAGGDSNASRWVLGGAVTTSALSSACCWLPLIAIAVGASASGVAAFFEAYRVLFLAAATLLLVAGFHLVYVREPACQPDGTCVHPDPRLQRTNKAALWIATVGVAALAFFPSYAGILLGAGAETPAEHATGVVSKTYRVEGMTCSSCAVHLERALLEFGPVVAADVDYDAGTVTVDFASQTEPDDAGLAAAIEKIGYRVVTNPPPPARAPTSDEPPGLPALAPDLAALGSSAPPTDSGG